MKIAFWSNVSEACGVSANLAAVSVATVMRYPYSVIAFENRLCCNNLGKAFLGRSHTKGNSEVGTNYYDGGGMEGLMRKLYRGDYHVGMVDSYVQKIIPDHLYYVPQSKVLHSEIFDYEFNHCSHMLLNMFEAFADVCFIDTACHNNLSTKNILEESDLIVVNLCQKQSVLEDFFLNYSSLIPKSIFIVGNYEFNKKLNVKRISAMYEIPEESMVVLPINENYHNSFSDGSVVEFISRNHACLKDNPNFIFIQSVKRAAHMIMRKAVELAKAKEKDMCLR